MAKPAGEKVTLEMEGKFEEITHLTDAFCSQHFNAEPREMSRQFAVALCHKRPSP